MVFLGFYTLELLSPKILTGDSAWSSRFGSIAKDSDTTKGSSGCSGALFLLTRPQSSLKVGPVLARFLLGLQKEAVVVPLDQCQCFVAIRSFFHQD